jgi:hypothetical protein
MAARFSTGLRNKLLGEQGVETGANGFKGIFKGCVIDLYSGTQPTTADGAVAGTLLGRVTLDGAAFVEGTLTNGLVWDTPASGAISKPTAANWKFTGLADGTIGWFRCRGNAVDNGLSSTTLPRFDGAVGITSGELHLTVVTVTVGTLGVVQNAVFSMPAG